MQERVLDEIDTTFVSHYSSRISLAEAITVDAVKDYGARKTGPVSYTHLTLPTKA